MFSEGLIENIYKTHVKPKLKHDLKQEQLQILFFPYRQPNCRFQWRYVDAKHFLQSVRHSALRFVEL